MAQTVNLRLSRSDNSPWGFRLQGGKDFGQPLLIQKVNGGSLAERAGLQVGDAVIRVNNVDVSDMRHKDAQDTIVRAGNSFEVTVQRGGGSTWKPHVTPVGSVPQPGKASPATTVTKTSLAAGRSPAPAIGSGHNLSPKPFGASPQVNGDPSVKAIVNKQYNTPFQMYSEETIAETLSAQAEVLAGGAIGVNFMKNEKTYDSQKSEVFKMVQEVEKEPREPEQPDSGNTVGVTNFGLRHVQPPEPKPAPDSPQPQQLPPGQNICADCERLIVGVFVRIKDKNLHVECFKCATCGTSLKNVGYYTINNKLYCDIHAKLVARQNPPAPNLDPITVPPGSRAPAGAFTAPQVSAAPQSPQPGTLAPLPFHAPRTTTSHVVPPRFGRQTSAPSGPKPFGSVTAPSAPAPVPFTPSSIAPPSIAPFSSIPAPPPPSSLTKPLPDSGTPVVWPPTSQSQQTIKTEESVHTQYEAKRLSVCSEEVSSIASRKLEISSSIVEEDRPPSPVPDRPVNLDDVEKSLIKAGERVKHRSVSPRPPASPRPVTPCRMTPRHFHVDNPDLLDVSTKPHDIHSLLPPASLVRPLTPKQVVVFPPEFPTVMYSRSPTPRREKKSPDRCTTCPSPLNALVPYQSRQETVCSAGEKSSDKLHQVTHTIKKSESSIKDSKHLCETKAEKSGQKKEELLKSQQVNQTKVENFANESEEKHTKTHETTIENSVKSTQEKHGKTTDAEIKKESSVKFVEEKHEKSQVEKMFYTKSEVEKLIHEEVLKALALKESVCKENKELLEENVEPEISVHDLPKPIAPSGWMTSALTTASERPFTPVPFPKPMELPSLAEKIVPMEPIKIKKDEKPVPLPTATEPYFPPPPLPPGKEGLDDRTARALREVGCRSPMTEALTVAPNRPYSPLPTCTEIKSSDKSSSAFKAVSTAGKTAISSVSSVQTGGAEKTSAFKPVLPKPFMSPQKAEKFGIDMAKIAVQGHTKETVHCFESGQIYKAIHEKTEIPVPQLFVASSEPTPAYIPQPPKPKQETHISKTSKSSDQSEKVELLQTKNVPPRPTTPSGLHPPGELPYYQQNIGVIPLRNKAISPVPHIIKAPQLETNVQMQQGYKSTVYSETKTYSAQKSSSQALTKNITTTKETKIPECKSPQLWKLETRRTIQNLSPITVRLQSPRPATPVQGEIEQKANAKVEIHRPRPSSPLPPTVKVKVEYPNGTSSGPVIGSGKSAFALVKNGSSTQSKKIINSAETQNQISSGSSSSSQKCSSSNLESECSKKSSQAQELSYHTTLQAQDVCQKSCLTQKSISQAQQSCQKSSSEAQQSCQRSISQAQQSCQRSISQAQQSCQKSTSEAQQSCQQAISQAQQSCQKSISQAQQSCQQSISQAQQSCQKSISQAQQSCQKSVTQTQHCSQQSATQSQDISHKTNVQSQLVSQKSQSKEANSNSKIHSQVNQKVTDTHTSSSTKSEASEISSTIQKASHSGITSFRAYGESSRKTVCDNSFALSEKPSVLKLEEARVSKTFEEKREGKSGKKCLSEVKVSSKQQTHGDSISYTSSNTKSSFPANKQAIGGNKSSVGASPCPLPTFPSLPQLSDIPWTPGAGGRTATFAGSTAPKRGRGILNPSVAPGARIPLCGHCNMQIRGPFITALGKIWCPDHFVCVNGKCRRPLQDIGFVEEPDGLYCEFCYEQYLAPTCDKCHSKIKGDCLNAIGKHFHPECFSCAYCGKLFGNNPFFLEDALPYCEADWNELFTTKCFSCGFPIEAGDRWVEALNNNYHSQCFNCTMCKKNLEGQSFFAKAGRPFCKNHAR